MTPAIASLATDLATIAAAAAASALLIVVIHPLLVRYAVAKPNERSSHVTPTAQGGGIAVIGALVLVSLAAFALRFATGDTGSPGMVLGAALVLAVTGLLDDLVGLPIAARLVVQVAAVVTVVLALPADARIASFLPFVVERALLVLALVWFVNLVNFMDGLDWMTVAEVVPVTAALIAAGAAGALSPPAVTVALALLGAMLGFAPFNRPVARLFLGDAGSLPIGLVLGWLLILLAGEGHIAAALLLPLYYIADATITLDRRRRSGEALWLAHRTHFYQRATVNGYSVSQVVSRVFGVNVLLAGLALATIWLDGIAFDTAALAVGMALVGLLLRAFSRRAPYSHLKT